MNFLLINFNFENNLIANLKYNQEYYYCNTLQNNAWKMRYNPL